MAIPRERAPAVLDVPVYRQPNGYSCGPTSLKAVCWFHGREVSGRTLARRCGLTDDGTNHAGIVRGARTMGAQTFTRSPGTLAELRWFVAQGLPVIVGWWSREPGELPFDTRWTLAQRRHQDCGHYSVVSGVRGDRVWLMDPQWKRRGAHWETWGQRSLGAAEFLRVWYDTDTGAFRRIVRWYAVVHFDDRRFASRFPGGVDHR